MILQIEWRTNNLILHDKRETAKRQNRNAALNNTKLSEYFQNIVARFAKWHNSVEINKFSNSNIKLKLLFQNTKTSFIIINKCWFSKFQVFLVQFFISWNLSTPFELRHLFRTFEKMARLNLWSTLCRLSLVRLLILLLITINLASSLPVVPRPLQSTSFQLENPANSKKNPRSKRANKVNNPPWETFLHGRDNPSDDKSIYFAMLDKVFEKHLLFSDISAFKNAITL